MACIRYCVVNRRFIPSPCIASNLENSVISSDSGISVFVFGGLGMGPSVCDFIVGGSCIGSPARISFWILDLFVSSNGIQHCASRACDPSSMITISNFSLHSCLLPAPWSVANTTYVPLLHILVTRELVGHSLRSI